MKEYSDHLALEKSILKEIGMLPATADTQDIWDIHTHNLISEF